MLGFLTQFLVAVLTWIEERAKRGHVAIDADRDDSGVRRAGNRISQWMRKDSASSTGKPNPNRAENTGTDIHPYRRGVGSVTKPSDDS